MNIGIIIVLIITAMIIAISKFKIHPFWAMMASAVILALSAGIDPQAVISIIENGFATTLASIGLVIILGAMIGSILESSGAALKLVDMLIKRIGDKYPQLTMMLVGAIVSIPVFCDSGFVLLNPIRRTLAAKTKTSFVGMTLALSAGLFATHVLIPPTPGPAAAIAITGLNDHMFLVITMGLLVTIFALVPAYFYANFIGKKVGATSSITGDSQKEYDELIESYGKLPNGFLSILPILLPIALMAISSFADSSVESGFFKLLGKPVVALTFGLLAALLLKIKSPGRETFTDITQKCFAVIAPILLITAAGAALGKVIAATNFIELLCKETPAIIGLGIVFPFVLSALIKTAQGSSTVAITTTASLMGVYSDSGSLLWAIGLNTPYLATLAMLAIGAGSMTVSHANDSYFWVVTSLGDISPKDGYRTQTIMTLIMGIGALSGLVLLWALA